MKLITLLIISFTFLHALNSEIVTDATGYDIEIVEYGRVTNYHFETDSEVLMFMTYVHKAEMLREEMMGHYAIKVAAAMVDYTECLKVANRSHGGKAAVETCKIDHDRIIANTFPGKVYVEDLIAQDFSEMEK